MLKTKDNALVMFIEWCSEVENCTNHRVKCLRIDNGLKFVYNEFNKFYSTKRIKRHKNIPGHPQQNGVIE